MAPPLILMQAELWVVGQPHSTLLKRGLGQASLVLILVAPGMALFPEQLQAQGHPGCNLLSGTSSHRSLPQQHTHCPWQITNTSPMRLKAKT